MKQTDYSNVALGQEISGNTLTHEQSAVLESLKAITRALGVDSAKVTVLFGCVMVKNGNQYDQTAGAVVYQDEVYLVDAFSGNHATSIPVYQFYDVNVGAAVRFADLQYRNVHIDHKMRLVMAASGSGEANYNAVDYVKDKIYSLIGVQAQIQSYTDDAIASLVDSSPAALDTLNELAAALGDDPNFATTITNSIATKVAISAIVDNLNSTVVNVPLSAKQGNVLNLAKIAISAIINNLTSTSTTAPLSAAQGKVLKDLVDLRATIIQLDLKADESVIIKKDGTVAFTGDQSMGSKKLTNLATPFGTSNAALRNGAVVEGSLVLADFVLNVTTVTDAKYEYFIIGEICFFAIKLNLVTTGGIVKFKLPGTLRHKGYTTGIFWNNGVIDNATTQVLLAGCENESTNRQIRIEASSGNYPQYSNIQFNFRISAE